jgi:hypothetical protein
VPGLLADWRRVLKDGGEVLIAVPDLDVIARTLIDRSGWFTPPHSPWIGAIYGGQKDQYDFHKTGFNAPWLASLLDDAGFGDIRKVGKFEDIGVPDASFSPLPFGRNVSLNMRAVAGGTPLPAQLLRRTRAELAIDRLDRVLTFSMQISTSLRARAMRRRRTQLERAIGA